MKYAESSEAFGQKASSAGMGTRTARQTHASQFTQAGVITLMPPSPTPPLDEVSPFQNKLKSQIEEATNSNTKGGESTTTA